MIPNNVDIDNILVEVERPYFTTAITDEELMDLLID
jgi:hypothetical protein